MLSIYMRSLSGEITFLLEAEALSELAYGWLYFQEAIFFVLGQNLTLYVGYIIFP